MTTNKELRELAEGVKHWGSSIADAWPSDPDSNDTWSAGAIDEDGNKYPVIEVDADQYDAPGDSERLARFFTAANPVTVLALLDAYEALQAAYEEELFQVRQDRDTHFGELARALEQVDAVKAECERLLEALSIARDYVFSSLEEKKLALAGYPQMWRCEQDDLAMIDATLSAYRKETSHDK